MINPYMIIGGLAAVGGFFVLGVQVGSSYATGQCDSSRLADSQNASKIIFAKEAQLTQCEAQVSAINATVAQQGRKIATMLANDQRKRDAAQSEAIERDAELRAAQERVRDALTQLRSDINEGDFGVCAGESVPDDLIGLLNDALDDGGGDP